MNRQNSELAAAMRKEVERFYASWTKNKDKLFAKYSRYNSLEGKEKEEKISKKDPVFVATIDEPRYDFTSENTAELVTSSNEDVTCVDGPPASLAVDMSRAITPVGQ